MIRRLRCVRGGPRLVATLLMALAMPACGTSRSQFARAVLWQDADVDDIHRFPARAVPAGGAARPWIDAGAASYDSLRAPVRVGTDAASVPLDSFMEQHATTAFLVAVGDSLIHERYFNGFHRDSVHTVFSVSKSILSAALGAAVDRGLIGSLDDPVTRYVPELLMRDPAFASITLRHLVTMSSGLAWNPGKTPWSDEADTYYSTDLRRTGMRARVAEPPGVRFVYNNYNPLLIGLVVERAVGTTVSAFLSETVWQAMGAEADASWSLDRAHAGFEKMESGFNARARDLARFGALYLSGGRVDGREVLSRRWVEASVRVDSTGDPNVGYQHFWWVAAQPAGGPHFWAEGRFGQFIYVVPDLELVIVRLGRDDGDVNWQSFLAAIARRVAADRQAPAVR